MMGRKGHSGTRSEEVLALVPVQPPSSFKSPKVTWPCHLCSLCLRFLTCNRGWWMRWSLASSFPNWMFYGFITATSARDSWVTGAIS